MSDENTTPQSGSRWEPRADASGASTPPPATPQGDESAESTSTAAGSGERSGFAVPAPGTQPVEPSGRRPWTARAQGRGGLLAGALALVLVSGIGGFAISEVAHHDGGRLPYGTGYEPRDARFQAPPPGFGDDDHGFDGHGFGQDDGGQPGSGEGDDGGTSQGSSL